MRRTPRGPLLFAHDRALGRRFVAGADEAGRGSLAGPLVAAAVLFDQSALGPAELRALAQLDDSKAHDAHARAGLYALVMRTASRVAIVSRSAAGIDARGLHVTNLEALHTALRMVACDGAICLSDGFALAELDQEQRALIKGDATSAAIAAASVVAKETRDRYMRRVDQRNPGFGFARHVGYASPEHRSAIARLGVTPLHRRSFRSAAYQQLSLD